MRLGRPVPKFVLSPSERTTLEQYARRPTTAQALALRARIVLRCATGATHTAIAADLDVTIQTVGKWRKRFVTTRIAGLLDEPRPGAPRKITDAQIERAIATTLESTPRDATHWSTRDLAKHEGLSQSAVARMWKAFALQPHRLETFKLSKDPLVIDKVRDIVGLYLHPPDRALVLCVDEKSQIQALDRTAPLLPMRPGLPARRTHDYIRHGTTSLFAALDVKAGTVIGACHARHRAQEFRQFVNRIEAAVPAPSSTAGCCAIRASICTSRPPAHRGSILSNAGLLSSPASRSNAGPTGVPRPFVTPSRRILTSATTPHGPLSGRKPPTKSWTASPDFVHGSLNHDTRRGLLCKSQDHQTYASLNPLSPLICPFLFTHAFL